MLEIAIDNSYKCDLETIVDPNKSQYFWINRKDLEIDSKRNWRAIFDKCKDSSNQKYRKELTPNVTFQLNKIFVRNDLLEKIIKSCEATNLEFLKFKEKLGLCRYENICDQQELISTLKELFKEEKIITSHDVENKQLKEENEKLRKENEQLRKNNVVKDATIKEPMEIKSPKEDKNTTDYHPDWFDRNKFDKMLAIIDSKKFNYKNKIGVFKYIGIKDFVNNIRNNTISEITDKTLMPSKDENKKKIKRERKKKMKIKYNMKRKKKMKIKYNMKRKRKRERKKMENKINC